MRGLFLYLPRLRPELLVSVELLLLLADPGAKPSFREEL